MLGFCLAVFLTRKFMLQISKRFLLPPASMSLLVHLLSSLTLYPSSTNIKTYSVQSSPSSIPPLELLSRPLSLLMHSFIIAHTPDSMQVKRQNRLHCVALKARETWLPLIGHVLNGHKSPRTVNKSDRQHNCSALKPLRWLYIFFFSPDRINQVYTPPTHRSPIHHPLLLIPH